MFVLNIGYFPNIKEIISTKRTLTNVQNVHYNIIDITIDFKKKKESKKKKSIIPYDYEYIVPF